MYWADHELVHGSEVGKVSLGTIGVQVDVGSEVNVTSKGDDSRDAFLLDERKQFLEFELPSQYFRVAVPIGIEVTLATRDDTKGVVAGNYLPRGRRRFQRILEPFGLLWSHHPGNIFVRVVWIRVAEGSVVREKNFKVLTEFLGSVNGLPVQNGVVLVKSLERILVQGVHL
ncbi:unnamed protein product [Pseudo-nitzschia multistriata]|uniref:Uncharacterized protein n=1 Tax=Pseudo-nitzschia multistriata TaxID=183589 RepID=A0A448ZLL1_9STRA|nr:unnamed protein product [Pseudo-nitzschia multistriata]